MMPRSVPLRTGSYGARPRNRRRNGRYGDNAPMTATTPDATAVTHPGSRRQLRLALSMNGGVSLAVWIGGSVSEIDRVRRGDPFWSELLTACGYEPTALVDVMTGASAGGLNAVLYAQAIRNDRPYGDDIRQLWEDTADIETLIKDAPTAREANHDPRAILRGRYFLNQLERKLTDLAACADADRADGPDPQALAIFASATLAAANPVKYRDVPGASIDEGRSDAYFHVTRRGPASRGLDGFADRYEAPTAALPEGAPLPDQRPPSTARALALIGRATCSLPVLFEPVPFRAEHFGSRLVNAFTPDRSDVQIVDGGVIDNVPIARAIRAIASSHASTRTRRVLLYLHPDPSAVDDRSPEPATAIAVGRALFGKRNESLREDIDLLRAHNAAVERRNVIAHSLLASIGRSMSGATTPALPADPLTERSISIGCLLRTALDPAAELAWHAPDVPRVAALLDGLGPLSRDTLQRHLQQAGVDDLLVVQRPRRVVGHLLRLVRDLELAAEGTPHSTDRPTDLSDVKAHLYEILLLADLLHAYQLARFVGFQPDGASVDDAPVPSRLAGQGSASSSARAGQAAEAAVRRLRRSKTEIGSIAVGATIAGLTDEDWRALASWVLPPGPRTAGAGSPIPPIVDLLWTELRAVLAKIPEGTTAGPAGNERSSQAATTLNQLKDERSITIDQLDGLLLPLAAETIASDQSIDFVRVAGNIRTPASDAFADETAIAKLGGRVTGVQLRHLGAFFQTSWRTNDFRWGRLDSVPSLLDAILDPQAITALRAWAITATSPLALIVQAANVPDAAESRTADERLRELLIEHRQAQLLAELLPPTSREGDAPIAPQTVAAIAAAPEFQAWRAENRSLQHLLGTRSLTSTALRVSITGWRVLTGPLHWFPRFVLWLLRPVVLGLVGVVLAGRRAAAAIALTVCVLAASRAESTSGSWIVFGVGVVLTVGAVWLVEAKVRPRSSPGHGWVDSRRYLYGVTVLAVASGAALGIGHDAVRTHEWAWFWIAPGVAALNAWLLFFWMRLRGRMLMITLSAAVYALWSWNATWDPFAGQTVIDAAVHPIRGIWVCWLVAVIATTSILGHLPDQWLRPNAR